MTQNEKTKITVQANVHASLEKVWTCWTEPRHITQWNQASEDWHSPHAENDLKVGGRFSYRMEAKDGSMGFDFWGIYDEINSHESIANTLGDSRKVNVVFTSQGNKTMVTETFEAEATHSIEQQRMGWQAILDNFKKYVEQSSSVL